MKVFEVTSIFRVIEGVNIWTVTCEHHVFDHDWRIEIANEKGISITVRYFGPLTNAFLIELVKTNLFLL